MSGKMYEKRPEEDARYRGMVFVGVFQPLERHPHPRRAGPVGMTRWERDV